MTAVSEPKWIVEGKRPFVGAFRREFERLSLAWSYIGWEDGAFDTWLYREDQPEHKRQVRDEKGFIV